MLRAVGIAARSAWAIGSHSGAGGAGGRSHGANTEPDPVAFMTACACDGKLCPFGTTVTFETVQLVPSLRCTLVSVHATSTSIS